MQKERQKKCIQPTRLCILILGLLVGVSALCPAAAADTGWKEARGQDERIVAILFSVWQTKEAQTLFRDVPNLDLLEVNGMPMIKHVYEALKGSKYIEKIVVFAAPEVAQRLDLDTEARTTFVVDRGDAAENVEFGVGEVAKGDLVLFIPSDLVLVTSEGLDRLIERVLEEKGVDLIFPLVSREACEQAYPQEARTYGRFAEGQFTGAHIEFVRPDLFLEHTEAVKAQKDNLYNLYYMRKSTLGAVRFLGLKLTLKYIFGTLSVQDLEQHVKEKYEVEAKAIFWDNADLATDLSEPADVEMINRALQQRAKRHLLVPPKQMELSDRT